MKKIATMHHEFFNFPNTFDEIISRHLFDAMLASMNKAREALSEYVNKDVLVYIFNNYMEDFHVCEPFQIIKETMPTKRVDHMVCQFELPDNTIAGLALNMSWEKIARFELVIDDSPCLCIDAESWRLFSQLWHLSSYRSFCTGDWFQVPWPVIVAKTLRRFSLIRICVVLHERDAPSLRCALFIDYRLCVDRFKPRLLAGQRYVHPVMTFRTEKLHASRQFEWRGVWSIHQLVVFVWRNSQSVRHTQSSPIKHIMLVNRVSCETTSMRLNERKCGDSYYYYSEPLKQPVYYSHKQITTLLTVSWNYVPDDWSFRVHMALNNGFQYMNGSLSILYST